MDWKTKGRQLVRDIPAVVIALRHKETPFAAKILAVVIVCYAFSPIDLIPDFIPVLGLLDDLILLPFLIALLIRMIPKDSMDRYREEAGAHTATSKQKRWYYAIPVVVVWLAVLWLLFCIAT